MPSLTRPTSPGCAFTAAALVGAATGLRSQMGTALVVLRTPGRRLPSPLRSRRARAVAGAAALGELAVDKYPGAPPRTQAVGLVARVALGAVSGGLLLRAARAGVLSFPARREVALGAALGAGSAIGTSYGGLAVRVRLARHLPPVVAGLVEDAVAVSLAALAVRVAGSGHALLRQ